MPSLTRPSAERLAAMVQRCQQIPLNYESGLLSRTEHLRRWFVDRHDVSIGRGADDFESACGALRRWAQFPREWTMMATPLAPIEVGAIAGYSARALGSWWSYCCRILTVIDQTDGDGTRRFGFEYGTLRGHAERGEERFLVTMTPDGDVRFSLFAVSRPGRWFTWIGLPFARRAQARFRAGASEAMRVRV
jgi:uncharacterized protein (UPF0548 family)